jgi:methylenetetrahydrofolate dehydrogenase (NADP+)/methenyltetrahydrofolate cyclohydrolase
MLRWIAGESNQPFENWITNKSITVIGKGETGGKPIIQKLRALGVNPNIIDSKTHNPQSLKKSADIIISCVGKLQVIQADELKEGVILFSIGMSRGEDGKLHGDYEENEVKDIASYYSPVPGGVGPMNVAMLLKNVIDSASEMLTNENRT